MTRILDDRSALAAMKVLIGDQDHYPAVRTLITHARSQPHIISTAIRLLLARWNAGKNNKHRDHAPLLFAIDLLAIALPMNALIDTVIKAAAEAGLYGRFPELPRRTLKRNPDETEIALLISDYVNNKAVRSTSTEEKLMRLARDYCSGDAAEKETARIRTFQRDWNTNADL